MSKTPRLRVTISAYNASGYSIMAYRPYPFEAERTQEYIRMSLWCKENFYSANQARRLIREKCLLAIKFGGKIWVAATKQLQEEIDAKKVK